MNQPINQQPSAVRNAITRDLKFIPPQCKVGAFPGWEFLFSIPEGSGITIQEVKFRAQMLFPAGVLEDFSKMDDGKISVKILGTNGYPKPSGLDYFHNWLRGL